MHSVRRTALEVELADASQDDLQQSSPRELRSSKQEAQPSNRQRLGPVFDELTNSRWKTGKSRSARDRLLHPSCAEKGAVMRLLRLPSSNLEYGDFLYAPIVVGDHESHLTVLSALSRLDLDPWKEAAELSALPKDTAAGRLAR